MAVEKKTSTTKTKTSSPTPLQHPPYLQMISEAISAMKDRSGSSQPAIAKFIEENYAKQLPANFRKILSIQLKRFVKSEKLVKIKNSYKISTTIAKPVKEKESLTTLKEKKPLAKAIGKRKQATVVAVAKKSVEKAKKTKRLSQVKTPEGLKKAKSGTVKKGLETKKVKEVTPVKRKAVVNAKAAPAKKTANK